jgi:hypothetical protein
MRKPWHRAEAKSSGVADRDRQNLGAGIENNPQTTRAPDFEPFLLQRSEGIGGFEPQAGMFVGGAGPPNPFNEHSCMEARRLDSSLLCSKKRLVIRSLQIVVSMD